MKVNLGPLVWALLTLVLIGAGAAAQARYGLNSRAAELLVFVLVVTIPIVLSTTRRGRSFVYYAMWTVGVCALCATTYFVFEQAAGAFIIGVAYFNPRVAALFLLAVIATDVTFLSALRTARTTTDRGILTTLLALLSLGITLAYVAAASKSAVAF